MSYQYRFNQVYLNKGWVILNEAGLDEDLAECPLPEEWYTNKKVVLTDIQLKKRSFICITNKYYMGTDDNMIDYLYEIEQSICDYDFYDETGNVLTHMTASQMPEFMYDLIMYCRDKLYS